MRLDRFTSKFQLAISDAQSLALGRDHQYIEPVHLMTAMLNQQGGSVRPLLDQANINVNALRSALSQAIERLPRIEGIGGDVQ
ncbi:MAG: ATP-dependent Clp protease ATP-binding subunit ClpB [Alteromonadales bacterium]|jgi:ATP-dependent Clp protease ATP-binding subunit ClpB